MFTIGRTKILCAVLFAVLFKIITGCFNYHSTSINLNYLDGVSTVSIIQPFKYINNPVVEKRIREPEEIETMTEILKTAAVEGVYKPGDSRFPDIGFPDYYIDFQLGELEVRGFYWEDDYILLPTSLDFSLKGERCLLKLEQDFSINYF